MRETPAIQGARVRVTGGFWGARRACVRERGLMAVHDRFAETGRFEALKQRWKPGDPNCPHIFWDSDAAKWIEAAAAILMDKRDTALEARIDAYIDDIEKSQWPDGYFNSHFAVAEPENRFKNYTDHELYCLGHLIEAAVAYREATGKDKLMRLMIRYVDLVDRVFRVEHSAGFDTPGHEEIELALYRLYRATGEERFLTLMRYFIDVRGTSARDKTYDVFGVNRYSQAHLPVREQATAEGHAVRACYLYCGMADLALEDGDAALKAACERLFDNITRKRMYITGGIGSSHVGEAFTFDYDLMNRTAYAETCAALALALFARRMTALEPIGKYADIAELALYNGMLAGVSLDGEKFFYENPLEVHPDVIRHNELYAKARDAMPIARRVRVFECSCCPPNVQRVIGAIGDFAFGETKDALYAHHYLCCEAETRFGKIAMATEYPNDGEISIAPPAGEYTLKLRIPGWAEKWTLAVNGAPVSAANQNGYAEINRAWHAGDEVRLHLALSVRRIQAHPAVHEDCGRVAVMRGPIIYCAEEADCGKWLKDIVLRRDCAFTVGFDETLGVPTLDANATRSDWPTGDDAPLYRPYAPDRRRPARVRLIPYYAWANRDEGEMLVWLGCED